MALVTNNPELSASRVQDYYSSQAQISPKYHDSLTPGMEMKKNQRNISEVLLSGPPDGEMLDEEVGKTEGVQAQSLDTSAQCISDNNTVPDKKHHGFLGWLSLIPEIENPYNYGKKSKWLITGVVAIAAATAPMGASIFYREQKVLIQVCC